mmetsp:Transcript_24934/g.71567  ORF Transcript_24934/g.71567 Transcript_24934/m.71567 type:complete len:528 (-) Transcript_24934:349-1932(-)
MSGGKDKPVISLANFDENNPKCIINSPRSLQACKMEGVLPQELAHKPIEHFHERALSPRLVKLRYDFFEAKRRDLLAASRRARDQIVADERQANNSNSQQLELRAKDAGVSRGALLALQSDGLAQERRKLLKAQELEKKWLQNALNAELNQLKELEKGKAFAEAEGDKDAERQKEMSRKIKEMNDKRAQEEERKQMEAEARQKLEKQIAKEEFHKQQEEIKRRAEEEARRQKELYEKQCAEAERKKQAELEKERKREEEHQRMEARKKEMKALDLRRMEILEAQKMRLQEEMAKKQNMRDERIMASIQSNMELENKRREEFEAKQSMEAEREERLMQARALQQEEGAKRSFQLMMRRKLIQEEANKRAEERRASILDHQEEVEYRLLEHEQKKERYLDFKRELDGLRSRNKEINVERQRRREESMREMVAEQVRRKDDKIDALNMERKRLWQLRRHQQSEAYRAREQVKSEIMRQRIRSKFDSKALEKKLHDLMNQDVFTEKILGQSTSMPSLRPAGGGSMQEGVEA